MTPDDRDPVVKRLFEGLEPPPPPSQLRSRVLTAAGKKGTETPDLWTRIWNQRGLRLAWAATVVLFLTAHLLVGPRNGTGVTQVEPAMVAENRPDEQFADIFRPVQISANVKPIVGLISAAGDPIELAMGRNPS